VMAKSFERIHSDNLVNFGIIPLVFQNADDYGRINAGDSIIVRGLRGLITNTDAIPVSIAGKEYRCTLAVSRRQRAILLEGGLLNYTKKNSANRHELL
jgi:aconitate hydratase